MVTAFESTTLHRGLTNQVGENNCFLNVTIQALWHLGPFRLKLKKLIHNYSTNGSSYLSSSSSNNQQQHNTNATTNNNSTIISNSTSNIINNTTHNKIHWFPRDGLLDALCSLFIEYEFTDQDVLPPNTLRESLGRLSQQFELGEVYDDDNNHNYLYLLINLQYRN
jgi:hypothetical protein